VQDLQVVLGKRIRELRLKKGFSQESFADHCGLHRTYMGGIERGERNLTMRTVLTVAKGLGMTISQPLSGIEKQIDTGDGAPKSAQALRK
jgi:transcriptional regulator with XRE-family HTH domain